MNYDEVIPRIGYLICRHCTANWGLNDISTDFIDLTYIFRGKATYIIDNIIYDVREGDLLCIPKGSMRYAVSDKQNLMSCYAVNIQLYNQDGQVTSLPFPILSRIGISEDLLSLYQELTIDWLEKIAGYRMKTQGTFLTILHHYLSLLYYKNSFETIDLRIRRAIHFIAGNFSSHIEVIDLADMVGLNPVYFGSLFRKSTGFSVKTYINRIRINNAENLLSSGEFSVQDVAYKCGFEDIFYFSKVFKSIKGYSPSKTILNKCFQNF
jgi:AraC-like DNA-binding protein